MMLGSRIMIVEVPQGMMRETGIMHHRNRVRMMPGLSIMRVR
ncbi:MAG: hypothetical protein ACJ8J0_26945 [Longimicrobiaceae bacterium]